MGRDSDLREISTRRGARDSPLASESGCIATTNRRVNVRDCVTPLVVARPRTSRPLEPGTAEGPLCRHATRRAATVRVVDSSVNYGRRKATMVTELRSRRAGFGLCVVRVFGPHPGLRPAAHGLRAIDRNEARPRSTRAPLPRRIARSSAVARRASATSRVRMTCATAGE